MRAGFIFRITHVDNLPHILQHGVCCRSHSVHDPNFINIGSPELIDKRQGQLVPMAPGGMLGDYVPFYFTPHSPMLLNLRSGLHGSRRSKNEEIVIFLSSIYNLVKHNIPYLFTDRHASTVGVNFFTVPADLDHIDWGILAARDFARDDEDPGKIVRYMAEALVHGVLPIGGVLAIGCHNEAVRLRVQTLVDTGGHDLRVIRRPGWYFP